MTNVRGGGSWTALFRAFRISRSLVIVIALVLSLAANATLFVGGILHNVVGNFVESVTGLKTASAKQRKVVKNLQRENRQLRGQLKKVRSVARSAVKRTMVRSVKSARRSIATLAGKVLPHAGAAVAIGITVWEIKDLCDIIRDMNSIKKEVDPSEAVDDSETTVCSMRVPAAKEILSGVASAPQKAWEESKKFIPDLNSIKDTVTFSTDFWEDTRNVLGSHWNDLYFWRRKNSDSDD